MRPGDWIYEIKFDGYPALALRGGNETTLPTGSFPANGYGLYDMAGGRRTGRRSRRAHYSPSVKRRSPLWGVECLRSSRRAGGNLPGSVIDPVSQTPYVREKAF
jgi:hypothetical protein